ncbi:hypothetical protein CEXT_309161 [Caerostris extrusa]|uniref:Uncharacterized protein n=1 Tax=Caerostris extrusa TaxID=172846 RepID=A0AAV4PAP4_CAEEX|nr:hypothetical protein CEXT_309161 [Caerostris extrusa]
MENCDIFQWPSISQMSFKWPFIQVLRQPLTRPNLCGKTTALQRLILLEMAHSHIYLLACFHLVSTIYQNESYRLNDLQHWSFVGDRESMLRMRVCFSENR